MTNRFEGSPAAEIHVGISPIRPVFKKFAQVSSIQDFDRDVTIRKYCDIPIFGKRGVAMSERLSRTVSMALTCIVIITALPVYFFLSAPNIGGMEDMSKLFMS